MAARFRGVYAIPVTPFTEEGAVDLAALERVVEFTVAAGAHGLVMPVNVSEFFTLTDEERRAVLATTVTVAAGRVPVVAAVTGASTAQAAGHAEHATATGASAVIAMPPYVKRAGWTELVGYYQRIAVASGLPVFVQNADGPAGTPMPASQLVALAGAVETVSWVKEESSRSSELISELVGSHGIEGVMGGKGARYILDEYPRGICGTMPGCEFTDLHVALWDALEAGDEPRAAWLFRFLLPLVSMEDQYGGAAFCKQVLRRRGVLANAVVREPGSPRLDRTAERVLGRLLDEALEQIT
jgi:4-hydroxy-tetrahydrodipicolinate synthase